ncbi:hypothetical protein AB0O91_27945 [Kitasatospora sp. NPDC089797]|uniref:hypothetical protein n=1 Tax=Kitasatospora sp. NPDC089797 TaxID=3155298 RepID=UPI00343BDDD2
MAWALPEPAAAEAEQSGSPAAPPGAPAAVGAAGAVPPVREAAATAAGTGTARPGISAVPAPDGAAEGEGAQRRIPKPMVAAAVLAGLVLVGVPLGVAGLGGDSPGPHGADGPPPAGFSQPDGGGNGYVPGADNPGNPPGDQPLQPGQPGQPAEPGQPGAPQPGDGVVPAAAALGAVLPGAAADQGGHGTTAAGRTAAGAPGTAGAPAATQDGGQNTGQSTGQGSGQGAGAPQTKPQQPAPQQPAPPPAKPTQPAPPPAPTYHGVAGPGCGGSTSMQQSGWYDDGQKGWRKNSGGYTGDGCGGGFTSMPMSGAANKDDNSNTVVWTFTTGPLTTGSCRLSVYVPNGDLKSVGGAPTYYTVQGRSFEVNQVSYRGQWVSAGTFPLSGGRIAVTMHSRGQDWVGDSVKTFAHHAASAVKADCTG